MGLLDGIRVLDLSSVGPAARAAAWLADFGARVVKVGPMPRDSGAQISPPDHAYSAGRGTQRLRVDLKSDAGREVFLRLAEVSDVVIESFRPGVVDRLGVGWDAVRERNPSVVYCSTTGYGQEGPRSSWAGHDLNYLAMTGYLAESERGIDGKPPTPGATLADAAGGGMHAAMSILAALVGRGATGRGCRLDVSVSDGVLALMSLQADALLSEMTPPPPGSAPLAGRFACYDTYRAGDGGWLAIAAIEAVFWRNACRLLELPDECVAGQWDPDKQPAIAAAVTDALARRSRDEWAEMLCGADTCVTPVLSLAEVVAAEREVESTDRLTIANRLDGSHFQQLAPLLAGMERRSSYDLPDPAATHTAELLAGSGFDAAEIADLMQLGVVA